MQILKPQYLIKSGYYIVPSASTALISGKKVVAKSYNSDGDPIKTYCVQHSTPLNAIQEKCMSETLKHPRARMLGAPEVITLNAALIKALGGKKVRRIRGVDSFINPGGLAVM